MATIQASDLQIRSEQSRPPAKTMTATVVSNVTILGHPPPPDPHDAMSAGSRRRADSGASSTTTNGYSLPPLPLPRFSHIKDLQGAANVQINNLAIHTPVSIHASECWVQEQSSPKSRKPFQTLILTVELQMRTLLGHAQQHSKLATTNIGFKKQDRAYVEHLVSSEILLNLLPRHKDYPNLVSDSGELGRLYRALCKVCHDSRPAVPFPMRSIS